MTSALSKRLDKVETELTPKEWGIRIADEVSQCETFASFLDEQVKKPETGTLGRCGKALRQVVEKKHPGKTAESIRAFNKAMADAILESRTLINLILDVNQNLTERAEKAGFQAAWNLQVLQTIILQDSFSRTAAKAAEWIELVKGEDEDEEENRQVILKELEAYRFDSPMADAVARPRSLDLGAVRIDFPAAIEDWLTESKSLIFDLYSHRLAVSIVEEKYFDGHRILAKKTAEDLERIIGAVEAAVDRHNQYLALRERLFSAEWEEDEDEGFPAGLSGERQGRLELNLDNMRPKRKQVEERIIKGWLESARMPARHIARPFLEAGR